MSSSSLSSFQSSTTANTNTNTTTAATQPVAIYKTQASLSHYRTTSISKHYALNNTLLAAFESHYDNKLYAIAYTIGIQFVETALLEIPKHGYFYSQRHEQERVQNSLDAIHVTDVLRKIIDREGMESSEIAKVQKLQSLAMEQYERNSMEDYEQERSIVEAELKRLSFTSMAASASAATASATAETQHPHQQRYQPDMPLPTHAYLTSTLLACGDSFAAIMCPQDTKKRTPHTLPPSWTPHGIPNGAVAAAVGVPLDEELVPPPLHQRSQSDIDLQRALFLSGLQVQPSKRDLTIIPESEAFTTMPNEDTLASPTRESTILPVAPPGAQKVMGGIGIQLLLSCYHEDFDALRNMGRVRISRVPTYQGRIPDSTNGCTIIAPLLCIHHFHNEQIIPDPGLPDQVIIEVLDVETPSILPKVRHELGLVPDAFLIPSDAHDYLMQQQYMCPEQFVDVVGGNILEESHLAKLVEHLSVVGPKKMAATVFFHEHVITILQLRRSPKQVWFDIIDSLPHEETLLKFGETTTGIPATTTSTTTITTSKGRSMADIILSSEQRNRILMDSVRNTTTTTSSSSGCGGGTSTTGSPIAHDRSVLSTETSTAPLAVGDDGMAPPEKEHEDDQQENDMADFLPLIALSSENEQPPDAARIRCLDAEALKVTLRWYACSVFTDDNKAYIDTYQWDDINSDFDPRVFQAFIWTEV